VSQVKKMRLKHAYAEKLRNKASASGRTEVPW